MNSYYEDYEPEHEFDYSHGEPDFDGEHEAKDYKEKFEAAEKRVEELEAFIEVAAASGKPIERVE